MRRLIALLALGAVLAAVAVSEAQPPQGGKGGGKGGPPGKGGQGGQGKGGQGQQGVDPVEQMMKLDKNADGKLTKDEITDQRMMGLWQRADADKDGSVTRQELQAVVGQQGKNGGKGPPPKK